METNDLIDGIYKKDEKSFEIMVNMYNKYLWAIIGGILSKVGTPEDIEECISDVYFKLWDNPKIYDRKKGTLKSFLTVMGKNKALDKYRLLTKVKIVELNDSLNLKNDDLLEFIINEEVSKELYAAICSLKEPDKEIMIRRYYFEEKPTYIANTISMSIKEVENRLYQSKIKLKKILCVVGEA